MFNVSFRGCTCQRLHAVGPVGHADMSIEHIPNAVQNKSMKFLVGRDRTAMSFEVVVSLKTRKWRLPTYL